MGRHEIKLRRHRMTSGRIEGFRNYHEVLERHKKASRMRKVFKLGLFLLFFVVLLITTYFIFAKKETKDNAAPKAQTMTISRPGVTPTLKGESRLEGI
ncbi:MAG TPA: hypothetical protein PKL31_12410 [Fulvivirga sp.]|nr:hypothetical protein [Fulvivirga sp.]